MKAPDGMDFIARKAEGVRRYHEYCSRFYEYLESAEGKKLISLFDVKYPNSGLTDAKKLDFILWADV